MSDAGERDKSENRGQKREAWQQERFLVVGLGASAGGIRALQTFFEGMPADSGMAFVVVMHLSPDHESNLAAILQSRTIMPVVQITANIRPAPNHVYVIPPNKLLFHAGRHA